MWCRVPGNAECTKLWVAGVVIAALAISAGALAPKKAEAWLINHLPELIGEQWSICARHSARSPAPSAGPHL
jgi:hypothetical protein